MAPRKLIDWVDFIQWGSRQYISTYQAGRALGEADLGPVQFRIRREVSVADLAQDYRPVDGDAAYLPASESVYAVIGYSPTFRLAAHRDGRVVLYEVDTNPQAGTGRDLLDIGGKVRAIALLSKEDTRTVIGRIDDSARIDQLVSLILNGPVDQLRQPSGQLAAFVSFQLADGTATTRAYFAGAPMLGRGILIPRQVAGAFDLLVANAPTPTPMPATVNLAQRYHLASAVRVYLKPVAPGPVPSPAPLQSFVQALDVELPTLSPVPSPSTYTVVGFEFSDHFVAFEYDPAANTLTVGTPADHLAVSPPQRFRDLLQP